MYTILYSIAVSFERVKYSVSSGQIIALHESHMLLWYRIDFGAIVPCACGLAGTVTSHHVQFNAEITHRFHIFSLDVVISILLTLVQKTEIGCDRYSTH